MKHSVFPRGGKEIFLAIIQNGFMVIGFGYLQKEVDEIVASTAWRIEINVLSITCKWACISPQKERVNSDTYLRELM